MKVGIIFILVITVIVYSSLSAFAKTPAGEVATTNIEGLFDESEWIDYDSIERIYEVSSSSLYKGYIVDLKEKEALKIEFFDKVGYFIVKEVFRDRIVLSFSGDLISIDRDSLKLIDITGDNSYDLEFLLSSTKNGVAILHVKRISEELNDFDTDYKELLDVIVEIPRDRVYGLEELTVFISFVNFGEGPSKIDIVYSITDDFGKEFYKGVNSKIVYTEDSLIKNFDFLNLPVGRYNIKSEIFYGDNQIAVSEKNFQVLKRRVFLDKGLIIFFISFFLVLIAVYFFRKRIV